MSRISDALIAEGLATESEVQQILTELNDVAATPRHDQFAEDLSSGATRERLIAQLLAKTNLSVEWTGISVDARTRIRVLQRRLKGRRGC